MVGYDFQKIEKRWQKAWADKKAFEAEKGSKKKKFYALEMFPYPSGKLHMGHVRNFSIMDAFARYKRMAGYNVLYPIGYDALGLPAENAAIKNRSDPETWTLKCIEMMKEQQQSMGFSYDMSREVATCRPEYYRWNQWIFLKLFEKGIAYKKEAPINWCPGCATVLANEQVEDGKCWRCKSVVVKKDLSQWFFKITEYADELLDDLNKLDEWPEKVKVMQKNWIGRSEGTEIYFKAKDMDLTISTFTTRPDTVFGITYLVFAPEHPLVRKLIAGVKDEKKILKFISKVAFDLFTKNLINVNFCSAFGAGKCVSFFHIYLILFLPQWTPRRHNEHHGEHCVNHCALCGYFFICIKGNSKRILLFAFLLNL